MRSGISDQDRQEEISSSLSKDQSLLDSSISPLCAELINASVSLRFAVYSKGNRPENYVLLKTIFR